MRLTSAGAACRIALVGVLISISSFAVKFSVASASVQIRLLADYQTALPGGVGTFRELWSPAIQGDTIAFHANWPTSTEGVYAERGGQLKLVAGRNTLLPGSNEPFTSLGTLFSIDSGRIAFSGESSNHSGVFVADDLGISTLIDSNTLIPGTMETFAGYGYLHLEGDDFGFDGHTSSFSHYGTYKSVNGVLTEVASNATPGRQGIATLDGFSIGSAAFHNGHVAFYARETEPFPAPLRRSGIYTDMFDSLELVANSSTPMPDSNENFFNVSSTFFVIDDSILFSGHGSSDDGGIFRFDGESITTFEVDSIPQRASAFHDVSLIDVDGDHVVIIQTNHGRKEYFTNVLGPLVRVVGDGDVIAGKVAKTVTLGQDSLSGNQLVFVAEFNDVTAGIFVATIVPEPAGMVPLVPALVIGLAMLRPCRRSTIAP